MKKKTDATVSVASICSALIWATNLSQQEGDKDNLRLVVICHTIIGRAISIALANFVNVIMAGLPVAFVCKGLFKNCYIIASICYILKIIATYDIFLGIYYFFDEPF